MAFAGILAPCVSLVAPVGMTDADRTEWYHAAWVALSDYPADLLQRGAKVAMRSADHPSKIVPAIVAEIEDAWLSRREAARNARALPSPRVARPVVEEKVWTQDDIDQCNRDFRKLGLSMRYRLGPNGTCENADCEPSPEDAAA